MYIYIYIYVYILIYTSLSLSIYIYIYIYIYTFALGRSTVLGPSTKRRCPVSVRMYLSLCGCTCLFFGFLSWVSEKRLRHGRMSQ